MAVKIPIVKKPGVKQKLTQQQIAHQQDYAARHPQHAKANGIKIPKVKTAPPATDSPPAVIPPVSSTPIANTTPTDPTAGGDANTLFPNERMFEPQNYEGSPLYQFQLKEGQKQVARSLAARGLRDSGTGIQEELDVPMRAAAQDTDRMTRIAEGNADRLQKIQSDEAMRLERQGNNQWSRIYDTASLMANQSPWNQAIAGLNNSADITRDAGNAQANFLKDYYNRAGGGGGGGRGGSVKSLIPVPTSPDYSNIIPTQLGGQYSSNQGWLNLLTSGLSSIWPK